MNESIESNSKSKSKAIPSNMAVIETQIEKLSAQLDELLGSIGEILTPEYPVPCGNVSSEPDAARESSFAERLGEYASRLKTLNYQVMQMIQRIEL